MGNRRKIVYPTDRGPEKAFIVLAGLIPSLVPPEPEKKLCRL